MRPSTKMLMMARGNKRRDYEREDYPRDRYDDRGRVEYRYDDRMDDRFRDRRGREHYDNGRFAPRNEYDVEDRHRDSRGRFIRSEYEPYGNYPYDAYPSMHHPRVPPIYENEYRREQRPMNKIGFSIGGEMEKMPREFDRTYREDEMAYRHGGERMMGYGASHGNMKFTREMAEEWTKNMENADKTHGAHWTMEQTKQVLAQRKLECDPIEFYAILNAMYSDYSDVAKKHGVNNMDFYADLAKAWLNDKDSVEDKAAAYFEYVVKH